MSSAVERDDRTGLRVPHGATSPSGGAGFWAGIWTLIGRAPAHPAKEVVSAPDWRRLAGLAVLGGLCLMLIAVAQGLGRAGSPHAAWLFWATLPVLVALFAFSAVRSESSRLERLVSVMLLGQALHVVKVVYSPTTFLGFDESLHVRTALDIVELHALFANNPLLPMSPLYPGLEVATAPLISLTGLDIFPVAVFFVTVTRFVSVGACFLLFEKISGSSRLAAIGVLVVMSSTSFVSFHAQYAYETLAFSLFLLVLGCTLRLERAPSPVRRQLTVIALLLLPVIAVTHHLTSYLTAAIIAAAALLMVARPAAGQPRIQVLAVAAVALALPPIWKEIVAAPTGEYIGPHVVHALADLEGFLTGAMRGRTLFVGADGVQAPVLLRAMGILSVLVIGIGLLFGFFRALTFRPPFDRKAEGPFWLWPSSAAVLLALLGAAFPVTVIFKLTSAGWEIGNRLGIFTMIGAGFVCALSFTHFWRQRLPDRGASIGLTAILSLAVAGGVFNGWGAALRTGYQVSADALSIEPLGMAVARWSRTALGEGNRFVADRTNAILVTTLGRQSVLSTLNGDPAIADLFFGDRLGSHERSIIATGFADYVLVDRRLPSDTPKLGHYYEPGDLSRHRNLPPPQRNLTKFDHSNEIGRIFDAGAIIIYDVRGIRH